MLERFLILFFATIEIAKFQEKNSINVFICPDKNYLISYFILYKFLIKINLQRYTIFFNVSIWGKIPRL